MHMDYLGILQWYIKPQLMACLSNWLLCEIMSYLRKFTLIFQEGNSAWMQDSLTCGGTKYWMRMIISFVANMMTWGYFFTSDPPNGGLWTWNFLVVRLIICWGCLLFVPCNCVWGAHFGFNNAFMTIWLMLVDSLTPLSFFVCLYTKV